jgi:hypothetical protein
LPFSEIIDWIMSYQVTEVEFDFDDLDTETQDEIYDNVFFLSGR